MGDLEHRVEPDRVERADRGHVERRRERDAQRNDAVERTVEVLWGVRDPRRSRSWRGRPGAASPRCSRAPTPPRRGAAQRGAGLPRRSDIVDLAAVQRVPIRSRSRPTPRGGPFRARSRRVRRRSHCDREASRDGAARGRSDSDCRPASRVVSITRPSRAARVRAQTRELRARERNELVGDRWKRCRKDVDPLGCGPRPPAAA